MRSSGHVYNKTISMMTNYNSIEPSNLALSLLLFWSACVCQCSFCEFIYSIFLLLRMIIIEHGGRKINHSHCILCIKTRLMWSLSRHVAMICLFRVHILASNFHWKSTLDLYPMFNRMIIWSNIIGGHLIDIEERKKISRFLLHIDVCTNCYFVYVYFRSIA